MSDDCHRDSAGCGHRLPRLNAALRRQREKMTQLRRQDNPCPFCEGRNRQCGFLAWTTEESDGPAMIRAGIGETLAVLNDAWDGDAGRVEILTALRKALQGQIVRLTIDGVDEEIDLGGHLQLAGRRLCLGPSGSELPLLEAVLGAAAGPVIIIPALVLQTRQPDLMRLDRAAQSEILAAIRPALDEEVPGLVLGWTVVVLRDGAVTEWTGETGFEAGIPYGVELTDPRRFYHCQEVIDRHWADVEEALWREADDREG
ncbi:hypothetical protein, partial [Mycobacterium tuberculosis]|uniref:hypothetical protein n=1 Tax=Mycobacterium tuberculosis TaxID=1773 RepID=UPI0012663BCD